MRLPRLGADSRISDGYAVLGQEIPGKFADRRLICRWA